MEPFWLVVALAIAAGAELLIINEDRAWREAMYTFRNSLLQLSRDYLLQLSRSRSRRAAQKVQKVAYEPSLREAAE